MDYLSNFECLVCGSKLPTVTKDVERHSSYGNGIRERTFYDTSIDGYFVNVYSQNPFLRPFIQAVNARHVDEEVKLVEDVTQNVLKAEYRADVLKSRKLILGNKAKKDIDGFSAFASEFARPFEGCVCQPNFAVHGAEPECIDRIMELGELEMNKYIVEKGKPDKMLRGKIILDVDTVIAKEIFPVFSTYFNPLKKYMKPAKANMRLNFMHFSEFKK